jgi:hypothetical protein
LLLRVSIETPQRPRNDSDFFSNPPSARSIESPGAPVPEVEKSSAVSLRDSGDVTAQSATTCHAHFVWKAQCQSSKGWEYIAVITDLYTKKGGKPMGNFDQGKDHWITKNKRSTPWSFDVDSPVKREVQVSMINGDDLAFAATDGKGFYCDTRRARDGKRDLPKGCGEVVAHGWTGQPKDLNCKGLKKGEFRWVVCHR